MADASAGGVGGAGGGGAGGVGGRPPDAGTDSGGGPIAADGGSYTCTPGATELCDGRDNDCDLQVDESACGVNCEGHASSAHGYMLCNGNYDWNEAKALCEAAGLVLARIDSQEENDFATAVAFAQRTAEVWFGGTDAAVEGDWRWTDGTAFWSGLATPAGAAVGGAYTSWRAPDQPDNLSTAGTDADCVALFQGGEWDDQACNFFSRALCRTP